MDHKNEKEKLKKQYSRTLKLVLNTELSTKNKIQIIVSLAILILRCNFGLINYNKEELQSWVGERGNY
jgi:hypothetical protein